MNLDEDAYNQPTEPRRPIKSSRLVPTSGQVVPPTPVPPAQTQGQEPLKRKLSRRTLMGVSLTGLAGLSIGGVALEQWVQYGGLNTLLHGPMASSMQTGHMLRRAGFGATADELAMYRSLSYSGAVDRLINYSQVSDDDTEKRLQALNLDLSKPVNQQRWWLLRMVWTQRPLLEKMTLFWHGVLTSSFRKVGGKKGYARMMIQNQFLRTHVFDSYDNILLGITSDPAMLVYLDLTKSSKHAPNENYARELMELFTLGLGHYSQQDVFEGAAALTGWHVKGETARYVPSDHNDLPKHYLGQTGNFDYKDVIRILTNHPATPWFICRKLFTFYAYENPSNDDLKPLVDAYVQSNHNMGEVMRTLLLSPQFSSKQAYRNRVKSPVEYTVGALRALNGQGTGDGLPYLTALMGQTLFDPPNVAGWPGDKVSALWLNSGTWMMRLNFIDILLARGKFTGKGAGSPLDLQSIVDANNIDSPEHFVDYFAAFLLDGVIEADLHTQLVDYFMGADTSRGNTHLTLKNGHSYPLNRARGTLYLMLTSPAYQLN
ncbi:MAG: hypothetical protein NVSMB27_01000 [Ktedonobacteraceae bacterium]